ncbi:HD-GYP domain-containing protein [Vibrio viridaestus]|uniref:HD-GYP domain-containing protein n=1 Tax=Vibrio viridaestus TaxID=2487322 RepID=A0A3N9TJN7_9VIBR|nr:HD-GYP domain-containing protein [Vibrio viridaestus]RQW64539.1 HD-GYP domain-containing protein [Vibrio viridaestus]
MLKKVEKSVRVAIENVQVGMFVTAIEYNRVVNLASAGVVKRKEAIQQLADKGVSYVWVDVKQSSPECKIVIAPDPIEDEPEVTGDEALNAKPVRVTKRDVGIRRKKAKKIVTEAKGLANKILRETFDGKAISLGEVEDWADGVVDAIMDDSDAINFVSALRNKDAYLLEHSVNVACLLVSFGSYLKFDKLTLRQLAIGGIIHDLGKTKVKNEVLNKPGKLTDEEFEEMKNHQVYVVDLLAQIKGLSEISKNVCLMHHEKLDGKGYPNQLTADEITIYGRMSSIVDIYDALTAERCYKTAMSPQDAFKILLGMTPNHLDQELVYKFINCLSVYPIGSLVQLSDGSVGLVEETNKAQPLKPTVKCFYSLKYNKFISVRSIKLTQSKLTVERAVAPKTLGVDISLYYE